VMAPVAAVSLAKHGIRAPRTANMGTVGLAGTTTPTWVCHDQHLCWISPGAPA
jgi:hypothetical protein